MSSSEEIGAAEKIIQDHVLRPYNNEFHTETWRDQPEIPTKDEVMPKEEVREKKDFFVEAWNAYQQEPEYNNNLPHNIIKGPWPSKEEYIAAQYKILREDTIAGIRASVKSFKRNPEMLDDRFTHVYTDVHFKGLLLGSLGAAFRIEFSHERAGKQILWKQSSRLQQGTMVVLSPQRDLFRSVCKVAIVAARPIEGGLDQNPPQIDIFWGNNDEAVFDPVEPYVLLESRQGYFEASRHMLVALQKLRNESFRLSKHLAELNNEIGPPEWLEDQPLLDLTSLIRPEIDPITSKLEAVPADEEIALYNADVLQGFPYIPCSGMDESQMSACESMVTKKVSIVQGPPGTGKTFTSVSALRVMVKNTSAQSPPIIIAAQTNHALDQLMNHVLQFETNVLRLGGRWERENKEIQKRTLHALRVAAKGMPTGTRNMKTAYLELDAQVSEIERSMAPLISEDILSDETLHQHGIITDAQKESLHEEGWANDAGAWLGPDQLIPIPRAPLINLGLPVEESDLEYEQLQQVELQNEELQGHKDSGGLEGKWFAFRRSWTGRCPAAVEDRKIKKTLSTSKSLYDIPMGMRGPVYRYWEKKLNKVMLEKLKGNLKEYKSATESIRIVKWVGSFKLVRHLGIRVIGCTTTGLSKYRGLLAALQPRTLLIEEAAETLEGTIMAGMFESLQQLILVGDHQQLQAHATIRELEVAPYHLKVSMFERLINNSMSYTMLNKQRRMIPEIRKLLCIEPNPFYSNLQDHPSVLNKQTNRMPVPGMGGKNTYFFHHTWPEGKNTDQSRYNTDEAEMIAGFYNHLVINGTEISKITVLTFYSGQRKAILKELRRHPGLPVDLYFNVFTVDSYQGEENDVIILSLVRSNEYMGIGFLENKNRLVVALSRARRGLYIFGNTVTLASAEIHEDGDYQIIREPLWEPLIRYLREHGRFDLEGGLPVTCTNHGKIIHIDEAAQWYGLAGGCDQRCPGKLRCGHNCPYPCHPFDHSQVTCVEACPKTLSCGRPCRNYCGEDCDPVYTILGSQGELSQHGMPVAGGGILDSPTKKDQYRDPNFPSNGVRPSVSPKNNACTNQDIRKETYREFSGPTPDRYASKRSGSQQYGVDLQRYSSLPMLTNSTNLTSAKMWKDWDAKKADREAIEENLRLKTASTQVDPNTLVYKETFHAVKIEDGNRIRDPASSTRRFVPRVNASPMVPLAPQAASPGQLPFESIRAAPQVLHAVLAENDSLTLPVDQIQVTATQKNLISPKKPLSSKYSDPSTTRLTPNTAPSTKIFVPSRRFSLKAVPSSKCVTPIKNASRPKPITPNRSIPLPKSVPPPHIHPGSKAALDHPQALQQKEAEIEVMKKRIAEAENTKAVKDITQQNLNGIFRNLAALRKVGATSHTPSSGPSTSNLTDQPSLLDFDDNFMFPEDEMSSSLPDLLGLDVTTPAADPYCNTDDFDRFERQFM